MPCSVIEIKEKLLKALDKDNNVLNLSEVSTVISLLEKAKITKELLEETRLGKYVNEMRKKTDNKELARRAKNLVKKWQQFLLPQPQQAPGESKLVNGEWLGSHCALKKLCTVNSPTTSPLSCPGTPSSIRSNYSPGLSSHQNIGNSVNLSVNEGFNGQTKHFSKAHFEGTQCLSASQKHSKSRTSSPVLSSLSPKNHSHCETQLLASKSHKVTSYRSSDKADVQSLQKKSRKRFLDNDSLARDESNIIPKKIIKSSRVESECVNNNHKESSHHLNGFLSNEDSNSSFHKSPPNNNLFLDSSVNFSSSTATQSSSVAGPENDMIDCVFNNSLSKDKISKSFPSRVKTTAQLLEEMPFLKSSSETASKIINSQIIKESDIQESIVPVGIRPRTKRKNPVVDNATVSEHFNNTNNQLSFLSATKNEMVQKFLQSSVPATNSRCDLDPQTDVDPPPFRSSESPCPVSGVTSVPGSELDLDTCASSPLSDKQSQLPETASLHQSQSSAVESEIDALYARLPPLNLDDIEWEQDEQVPQSSSMNEHVINRLHCQNWENVNGNSDTHKNWHDWTRTFVLPSFDHDPLHILPYVNITD